MQLFRGVNFKRPRLFAAVFLCLAVCVMPLLKPNMASAAQDEEDNVSFRWAFGALVKTDDGAGAGLQSINQDRTLRTGDEFKMMVEPRKKCFVYVIYNNSQGEVKLLFPYSLGQFENDYDVAKRYDVPKGSDDWFELDSHTGLETFYLLASSVRLTSLENLIDQYKSAEPEKKTDLANQVLAEIHSIRKQHREVSSAAERPVRIGGSIRGLDKPAGARHPDISAIAKDISSTDFYARTFTIEHQ